MGCNAYQGLWLISVIMYISVEFPLIFVTCCVIVTPSPTYAVVLRVGDQAQRDCIPTTAGDRYKEENGV